MGPLKFILSYLSFTANVFLNLFLLFSVFNFDWFHYQVCSLFQYQRFARSDWPLRKAGPHRTTTSVTDIVRVGPKSREQKGCKFTHTFLLSPPATVATPAPDSVCLVPASISGPAEAVQQCGIEQQISKRRGCWLQN